MPLPNEEKEVESLNLDKPSYTFIPKGNHEWRQSGYYIVCFSCDLKHGAWIGPDKVLVGINDKGPILKTRKELGLA